MSGSQLPVRMYRLGVALQRLTVKDVICRSHRSLGTQHRKAAESSLCISSRIMLQNVSLDHKVREKMEKEYICPSRLSVKKPDIVILDRSISSQGVMDCPTLPQNVLDIVAPEGDVKIISEPVTENAPIEASQIQLIRRKKMRKHKYEKMRKRLHFKLRAMRLAKERKAKIALKMRIASIAQKGEDFDAEAFVHEKLKVARRGGYYINVFESQNVK